MLLWGTANAEVHLHSICEEPVWSGRFSTQQGIRSPSFSFCVWFIVQLFTTSVLHFTFFVSEMEMVVILRSLEYQKVSFACTDRWLWTQYAECYELISDTAGCQWDWPHICQFNGFVLPEIMFMFRSFSHGPAQEWE